MILVVVKFICAGATHKQGFTLILAGARCCSETFQTALVSIKNEAALEKLIAAKQDRKYPPFTSSGTTFTVFRFSPAP